MRKTPKKKKILVQFLLTGIVTEILTLTNHKKGQQMAKKILITGGAGYLGSVMTNHFLNLGYNVTILDNFMYNQASLAHLCHDSRFNIVRADCRVRSEMERHVKSADIVIPLAGYVGAPLCARDPVGATSVNRDAIFMLMEIVSKEQLVIMPATNRAYGTGDVDNYCDEKSPLRPISQYAREKVEVEKRLMDHPRAISLRLATVFGMSPRIRLDLLVNDFVYRSVTDKFLILFEGNFKRNYIHIQDVARAFSHAAENLETMTGEIYNVGLSSANISKLELCEIIKRQVPNFVYMEAPVVKDPDQRNYIVSNEKIEKTGYMTTVALETGISELIKGYQMIRNSRYGNI